MKIREEAMLRIYLTELAPSWLVKFLLWRASKHVKDEGTYYVRTKAR
jgi:hypothetical protein